MQVLLLVIQKIHSDIIICPDPHRQYNQKQRRKLLKFYLDHDLIPQYKLDFHLIIIKRIEQESQILNHPEIQL